MFTQNNIPRIYAYTDKSYPDMLKVGYTTKTAAEACKRTILSNKTPPDLGNCLRGNRYQRGWYLLY